MWRSILLLVCVVLATEGRPQSRQNPVPTIEFEKQKVEENTKEILQKIAEVNKKQGLTPRKQNQNYFHFPFSYTKSDERQRSDFKFATDPFRNPIFEYLEKEETKNRESQQFPLAEATEEDMVPGQYIKRKIVHQQTVLIPNPDAMVPLPMQFLPMQIQPVPPQGYNAPQPPPPYNRNYTLEKQTVDYIRDIVSSQQYPYYDEYYKGRQNWNWPGAQYFPIHIRDPFVQMYNAITSMVEYGPGAGIVNPCPGKPRDTSEREGKIKPKEREYSVAGVNPNELKREGMKESERLELDLNVGKDKDDLRFVMTGPTQDQNRDGESHVGLDMNTSEDTVKLLVQESNNEPTKNNSAGNFTLYLDTANDSLKFLLDRPNNQGENFDVQLEGLSVNQPKLVREVKDEPRFNPWTTKPPPKSNATRTNSRNPSVMSPPNRDPTGTTPEFGVEEEKSEEIISNDGNKKLFSKDNTGSGVFIHKLKVKKGGVAIAGPGGIATAGSGGTAIVGPNGVAYTHPDSLAIAGSGTKVVAVDPTINLGDLINGNSTRVGGIRPTRVGKVVAVGPVVYYNKGR